MALQPAGAQEAAPQRLRELQEEIRALEKKAASAVDREQSLMYEVGRLDRLASLRREEREMLSARAADVMKKVETSETRLASLHGLQQEAARALLGRVEEVRRVGSLGYLGALLARSRRDGFLTALRQLSYLAQRDRRRITLLEHRMADLVRIREDLQRTDRVLTGLQADSRSAERKQRAARDEKSRLLESIRREKVQALRLKEELEGAAARLQEMLGGLAAAPARVPDVPLSLYEGELEWPVKGRITQEFGRVGDTRFDIPYPGIDIWAPLDSPVRSVAGGTVVYADWFHGYGKTVCVDHGAGYITVYSHLADILVRPGQRVARGETVARLGDTGSLKGPHLYFQLTKDGKPLDPRKWFRS
jgi:septal ring factor EnvC (AmiA/AmiB activator)